MKKYIYYSVAACMMTMAAMAQETYESAQIATEDLNGTARYIGMGGAMEALGADISTIGTNPAGTGLMRRSTIGFSAGLTTQQADKPTGASFSNTGVTNADFNQLGFVYSNMFDDDRGSRVNFSVNYHKSRNFNQIVNAINGLNNSSANKLSYMRTASLQIDPVKSMKVDPRDEYVGLADVLTYNVLKQKGYDETDDVYYDEYNAASKYAFERKNSGYIGSFDFNISGSINDRVFLGLTVGVEDVHYRNYSLYNEQLVNKDNDYVGNYTFSDERKVTGNGYNIKFGTIIRPLEESPLRIGLYVHTPTWYTLDCRASLLASSNAVESRMRESGNYADYRYALHTPWKFGVSLGHTIGDIAAIGLTYQYSDYSTIKNRIPDEHAGYDYYDDISYTYRNSYNDDQMNDNTRQSLKGVSLLKAGLEIKAAPDFAIRAGYNWESAIYKKEATKDVLMDAYYSNGSYASTYDFINWYDTHRFTLGLGFALTEKVNLDLSYQYITQKGDFHPFQSISNLDVYNIQRNAKDEYASFYDATESNFGTVAAVKNNRHQMNLSLSYRF